MAAIELSYKSIFKMTLPIMLGGFIQFILTFTDTAFLGRLGEVSLNAAGNGGLLYMTAIIACQGISEGVQILIARRNSQKEYKQVGVLLVQSLYIVVLFSAILYLLFYGGKNVLITAITSDPILRDATNNFLDYRSIGAFFALAQLAINAYFMGIGSTRILILFSAITAFSNIGLDYILIFGKLGFPAMNEAGAGLASSIAEILSLLFSVIYLIYFLKDRNHFKDISLKPEIKRIKKILKLSAPLMGQRLLSMSGWTVFFFIIEKMGSHDLAISQLIRSLYFLTFIPVMGFSICTRTFTSHFSGTKEYDKVRTSIKKIMIAGLVSTVVLIHGYFFYPELILSLLTNNPVLIADTAKVLKVISFSMILFTLSNVLFNAVGGIGDTRATFIIESISIAGYLAVSYYLTIIANASILQVWCLEFLYFGTLALYSLIYFKFFNWKKFDL